MKLLTACKIPGYEEKMCVVLEETFNDRENGTSRNYCKAYVVPANATKLVQPGDEVRPLYNRFNKIEMFQKA